MPYSIKRKGNRYQVVNTDTGKAYPPTTHAKAEEQLQRLKGIEKDWTANDDGSYTRILNGKPHTLHVK